MSGDQARSDHTRLSANEVRQTLSFLMPNLSGFWERPLSEYACAVYDSVVRGRCYAREDAMSRVLALMERKVIDLGHSRVEAEVAARQIAEMPVIQTGPHCHLLVNPDAFYTHLFSLLGLSAHSLRWNICYACSTVKFTETSKRGPGWLTFGEDIVNVFGLSRSRMDHSSICGLNGSIRFEMAMTNGVDTVVPDVARLRNMLPDASFPSAAEAIKAANQILWHRASSPSHRLLQFDDIDVADLLVDHFADPKSWLSSRFTAGSTFVESILRTLMRLNEGPWAGWIRQTTDFFWGLRDGKIFPLHLHEGLLSGGQHQKFEVRFDPESLATALHQREVVPNLLMTFLVISILPGIRVLGGCRQTVYYPLMRHLVASALRASGEFELLEALRADELPGLWGHRVLRPDIDNSVAEIDGEGSLMKAAASYGEASLADCAGTLGSFTSDPIWAQMARHVRNQSISCGDAEWQWA